VTFNFRNIWSAQVRIEPLVWFRIIFGILLFFSTARFWYKGWIEDLFITPKFFFTFYGFEWVKPLQPDGMYILFTLLLISSLFITIGFLYRISTIFFFLAFTYVELIDKTNYLNHYYFISLIAFLLCLLPAHRFFSLDINLGICKPMVFIPAWCINILKFQIACVYFFAGVAKINSYWLLEAQPLTNWLKHQTDLPIIGGLMKYDLTAYIYSWAGCVFDLTVPFFLLLKSTRVYAYIAIIIFHVITGIMFPIGVFPLVMIVLTTLFFSENYYIRLFTKIKKPNNLITNNSVVPLRGMVSVLLFAYITLQLLLPFRYLLYPGNLFWTEQGYRFSWRVMLIEKVGNATFYVVPENGNGKKVIELADYLTPQQIKQMSTQPDMILQFAHYLKDEFKDQIVIENSDTILLGEPQIYVDAEANLFNKGTKLLVDPSVNLAKQPFNLYNRTWITTYE
jgi:hypothetical protein